MRERVRFAAPRLPRFATVERAGQEETAVRAATAEAADAGNTPNHRPAPDGSRRPTRGEVHAFAAGTRYGRRGNGIGREDRPSPSRDRVRADTYEKAIESPPSTFRVSQVYP